jgi:hypothetical protein
MTSYSLNQDQKRMLSSDQQRVTLAPSDIDALAQSVLQYATSTDKGLASQPVELPVGTTLGDALLVREAARPAIEAALGKTKISSEEYNKYFCAPSKPEFATREFPAEAFALLAVQGDSYAGIGLYRPARDPADTSTRIVYLNKDDWDLHVELGRLMRSSESRVNVAPSHAMKLKL